MTRFDKISIGDTFVSNINSSKYDKYNDYLLILNVLDKSVSEQYNVILLTAYLVNNSKNYVDTITDKQCICVRVDALEFRFSPIDTLFPIEEHIKNIENIPVYPDKDGRLFQYTFKLITDKKNVHVLSDFKHIGSYTLPIPKNNFRSYLDRTSTYYMGDISIEDFTNNMLECYENGNLKKDEIFDKKEIEKLRSSLFQQLNEEAILDRIIRNIRHEGIETLPPIILKKNSNTKSYPENCDVVKYGEDLDTKIMSL